MVSTEEHSHDPWYHDAPRFALYALTTRGSGKNIPLTSTHAQHGGPPRKDVQVYHVIQRLEHSERP